MKIFVLDFVTSVGGVQTVYKNILPKLCRNHIIYFLDPYKSRFSDSLSGFKNIKVLDIPIKSRKALGWDKGFTNRLFILLKYGYEYFCYLFKLISVVKQNNFDLVYVSGKKELLFAYLLKIFTSVSYVYHCHGISQSDKMGFIYKLMLSSADRIICVSRATMRSLEEKRINKNKMTVIYNGVDIGKVSEFLKPDTPYKDCFKVLFAGAIRQEKGVHLLANAVSRLALEEGGISLDIFGEVTDKACDGYFKSLSKTASASNGAIRINGYTNDILSEISKCDLLVLPSENEGFGMVLIEAMCLKKPVIGSRIGGIPEIIDNEKTGLLFENKDADDLYEKIKYLKNNQNVAKKMGLSGRERAEKLFSLKTQVDLIDSVIRSKNL